MTNKMKTVKVAKLGSAVVELLLEDNATLEEAIAAAGISKDGCDVRINGRNSCGTLNDRDMITLVPAFKGGAEIMVKVAKLGGVVKEVMLTEGSSVEAALTAAGIDRTGCDLRVNGRSEYGSLRNGDMITLVPAFKGGC